MTINVLLYSKTRKPEWDKFIQGSKNAHFMFFRDYMDYHSDRFLDFSLMVYDEKMSLIAVLPANLQDDKLYSHQGLTFGGFIVDDTMTTAMMLAIFDALVVFAKQNAIHSLIYKCVPYIYHQKPAEEDRYALFRQNAKLIRRDVTSTICLDSAIRYSKGRKWSINKAKKENLFVKESTDYEVFWSILSSVLHVSHQAKPVHTLNEIKLLADKFPNHIKLYLVFKESQVIAGAVLYENSNIVHTQYLANSDQGRILFALDFLIDYLIIEKYKDKKYFDFGISNENSGQYLNSGLIAQKEGFGARAVVHDFYELEIK